MPKSAGNDDDKCSPEAYSASKCRSSDLFAAVECADRTLHGGEALIRHFESELAARLARFSDHITRLEVHFSKEVAADDGLDRRCVLEARPAGRRPVAISHHAAVAEACSGAAHKLESMLESTYGRVDDHKDGATIRHRNRSAGQ